MTTGARILLVEDEANLRRTITDLLKSDGYEVSTSDDGLEAQELAMSKPFDLIILDVMLPSRSGFDVCRHLRRHGVNTPILMLTARSELTNKVQGFKAGGDDYLTKPFETPELQARIEALLRRGSGSARTELRTYEFDGIQVDFDKSRLTKNGKTTVLGERECRLLRYLVERKGSVLSRDELLQEVWGYKSVPLTRTVDVHIAWLRQKIEDDPKNPQFIVTVHGHGYRFAR
jgi:two-component system alkaline phosphatase synthesis response regulator PhoP